MDVLSRRYFEGHDPLFPEMRQDLRQMQKGWDCTVPNLASGLGRGQRLGVGVLEQEWQETVAKDTAFVVDLAKAQTLRLMGEVDAASDLMAAYPVSDLVNSPHNDMPEYILPAA